MNATLAFLTVSVELCFLALPWIRACFSTVILNLCEARTEKYSVIFFKIAAFFKITGLFFWCTARNCDEWQEIFSVPLACWGKWYWTLADRHLCKSNQTLGRRRTLFWSPISNVKTRSSSLTSSITVIPKVRRSGNLRRFHWKQGSEALF